MSNRGVRMLVHAESLVAVVTSAHGTEDCEEILILEDEAKKDSLYLRMTIDTANANYKSAKDLAEAEDKVRSASLWKYKSCFAPAVAFPTKPVSIPLSHETSEVVKAYSVWLRASKIPRKSKDDASLTSFYLFGERIKSSRPCHAVITTTIQQIDKVQFPSISRINMLFDNLPAIGLHLKLLIVEAYKAKGEKSWLKNGIKGKALHPELAQEVCSSFMDESQTAPNHKLKKRKEWLVKFR